MLQFLDFDRTEDIHGTAAWDAMASPAPHHTVALLEEVAALFHRLHMEYGPPGPLDETHVWDCDLHIADSQGTAVPWRWQGQTLVWNTPDHHLADTRITVSLSLTGDAAFTHTLEQDIAAE